MVVEPHFEGQRRISVAVVEGSEGPIALMPSQEEVVSPEADFLDADIEAQRKLAEAEVQHMAYSHVLRVLVQQRLLHCSATQDFLMVRTLE